MFSRLFRSLCAAVLIAPLVLSANSSTPAQEKPIDRLRRDVTFLASDECEGRGVETKGINLAADHIAAEFKKAGLKPGLGEKGYFQPFTINGSNKLKGPSQLVLTGPQGQVVQLRSGKDFNVLGLSAAGKVTGDLVFAGYGATAKDIKYDDFAGTDLKDKVVVLLRRVPRWDSEQLPFDGKNKDSHAGLVNKFSNAETHKAAAIILVNDFSETDGKTPDAFFPFTNLSDERPRTVPVFHMKRDVLDTLLRTTLNQSLRDIEKGIDRDLKPRSAALSGWKAAVEAGVDRQTIAVKNVIGVLEGAGPLAKETIVLGAHYDHLGLGGSGSLAKGVKAIHHGADDNASGTSALMELARRFGDMKDRQGRRLVFIAFSAEERGLLGSKHYCEKEPVFPLESTAAMFNLDMVGRMKTTKDGKDLLQVEGSGTGKTFSKLVEDLNNPNGVELKIAKQLMPNSDHFPFFNKKIPVLFFWTGTHPEYHRPTDTFDRINYEGMTKIVALSEKVVARLASDAERPEFVSIPVVGGGGRGAGPKIGVMPGYEAGKKGMLVEAVIAGGAAQKAGFMPGDVIIEIGGQPVLDVNTYMTIMRQQKVGRPVDFGVQRGEKKLTLKVTPQ